MPTSRFGTSAVGSARSMNRHVRRRQQPLLAERRLLLAGAQVEDLGEARVEVGVLHHRGAAAEVRHDPEVEDLEERRLDDGTRPPQQERVDAAVVVVAAVVAAVGVQVAADAEAEGAVGRAELEAAGAGHGDGRGRLGRGRGFLLDLELPGQDAELLVERLDALFGGLRSRRLRIGRRASRARQALAAAAGSGRRPGRAGSDGQDGRERQDRRERDGTDGTNGRRNMDLDSSADDTSTAMRHRPPST